LDNLSVLDIGATDNGNQWQKEKDFIVRLVGLARTYGILIVLASHPRKMGGLEIDRRVSGDDIAGSNSIGNLAQYILSVHRFGKREKAGEKDSKGNFKRGKEPIPFDVVIDVLKNRPTGKMGEVNVFFDFIGYRFYETVLELYHRYKWDKNTTPIPSKDPNHHEGDAPEGFGED
jgi:hypothetical protein